MTVSLFTEGEFTPSLSIVSSIWVTSFLYSALGLKRKKDKKKETLRLNL